MSLASVSFFGPRLRVAVFSGTSPRSTINPCITYAESKNRFQTDTGGRLPSGGIPFLNRLITLRPQRAGSGKEGLFFDSFQNRKERLMPFSLLHFFYPSTTFQIQSLLILYMWFCIRKTTLEVYPVPLLYFE